MRVRVGVVGATGYTGGELIRLLYGHPCVEITVLTSRSETGKSIEQVLPHLNGLNLPPLTPFDGDYLAERCEVVFLAGETGFAMEHAPHLLERGLKVIDLSADFRLKDPEQFCEWYGMAHTAPKRLSDALYGLPELTPPEAYARASLIANPGCYPTVSLLALAPIVKAQWVDTNRIIVDAKSGVSGAGRSRVRVDYLFTELDENFKAYAVDRHRHTPEMEQTLEVLCGHPVRIRFTPHLVPMTRGILATIYAPLSQSVRAQALHTLYSDFYVRHPFVQIRPLGNFPATREVYGSNRCDIGLAIDTRTQTAVIIGVIDNLVKGAAGQAVQNLNLMMGWEQTMGLPVAGIAP